MRHRRAVRPQRAIGQSQAPDRWSKQRSRLLLRLIPISFALGLFWLSAEAHAEIKLDFWHSYTHQPSGVTHYSFHIASYKRGLFFGSCGPSTRSLQWEYDIDLSGNAPIYHKDQMTITSEGKRVEVESGTITIDPKQRETTIDLRVKGPAGVTNFFGNGTHRIGKLK
jgi:hypothetical protein